MAKQTARQQSVGLIETVKDGIVHGIEGTGDVTGAMVDVVSRTVAKTIAGIGGIATSLVHATAEVVQGTIQAVMDVGGDLGAAAKGIVVGVLRGSRKATEGAVQVGQGPSLDRLRVEGAPAVRAFRSRSPAQSLPSRPATGDSASSCAQ